MRQVQWDGKLPADERDGDPCETVNSAVSLPRPLPLKLLITPFVATVMKGAFLWLSVPVC